jgi:hypothetical protein
MKTKIGTIMEEDVVERLREFSVRRGRSISDVIQDAVITYMQGGGDRKKELHLAALKRLCSKPFNLSPEAWKEIMEEDYYEQ